MSAFNLLDVAIAMVFFFLLLSLITSAVNELIAAVLQTRAKFLESAVIRLLDSPTLANTLYDHPLIRNLWGESKAGKDRPSYIPSQNFALAVMDLVSPGTGTNKALVPTPKGKNAPAVPTGAALAASLKAAPPGKLRDALLQLVTAAGEDAAIARKNIEGWYNSTMDRISGAYKRRTQYWLFGIGLVATLAINGDSIVICKHLLASSTLTEQIANAAQQYISSNPAPAPATPQPQSATPQPQTGTAASTLSGTLSTLDSLGLPIGWNGPDPSNTFMTSGEPFWPALARNLGLHWAGWLITAFALSFGAPFWFDLLNRFMVVRSTVKPQEKSPDEPSKD